MIYHLDEADADMALSRRALILIRNEAVRAQHILKHDLGMPNIHRETVAVLERAIEEYDKIVRRYDRQIDNLTKAVELGLMLKKEDND